ncbi:FtsK/SpoIIIE domain-containing protein [Enterococcus sp. DIV0180]|uniref:FtsK/SpoIIIE domain-containing protein n=1 Tax=Enterococcus sp. DIV0180 TaxID=2774749 RepID=UPI003D2FD163
MRIPFCKKNDLEVISLLNKNTNWVARLNKLGIFLFFSILVINIFAFSSWESNLVLLVPSLSLAIATGGFFIFKRFKMKLKNKFYYRDLLISFIFNNGLYKEGYSEYEERQSNGSYKTKKIKKFISSAEFTYKIFGNRIIIYAIKNGDNYTSKMMNLDVELSALLGKQLYEKIEKPSFCAYHFLIFKPERRIIKSTNGLERNPTQIINLGFGIEYDPAKAPHILVAGGTGSGKSVFIETLITQFLKVGDVGDDIPEVYICDPKNSDLSQLSHYFDETHVSSSLNGIAKICRLVVEEMKARYEFMQENFKYGSSYVDHDLLPVWLVFDEMGAFQANGTDKNSKTIVNEVMDYIRQIILKGRQAGVFILVASQQMSANTLNTDLRDNLGLRVALGANSQEGYKMVFGSASPTPQPIEEKGAGFLYLQGSGKETAQYYEAPWVDREKYNFIEEIKKYTSVS